MRVYDTVVDRYSTAVNNLMDKQNEFVGHTTKINGKYWDAPIDSSVPGKLSAPDFVSVAQQTAKSKPPHAHISAAADASKDSINKAAARFTALFADNGPLTMLSKALSNGDKKVIASAMGKIRPRLNSKFYHDNQLVQQVISFIDEYSDARKQVDSKRNRNSISTAQDKAAIHAKRVVDVNRTIEAKWNELTAARYEEMIGDIMAGKLTDIMHKLNTPHLPPATQKQIGDIITLINSGNLYPTGIKTFINEATFSEIWRDAVATYDQQIEAGAKIMWIPKVKETEGLGVVRVGTDHFPSERASHDRALNMSYSIQNPFLGLAKVWQEHLIRKYSEQFFEQYVEPRLKSSIGLKQDTEQTWLALRKSGAKVPEYREYEAHMLGKEWTVFDPHMFFQKDSRYTRPGQNEMMISKTDLALLHRMNKSVTTMGKTWDGSVNLFRHAVLTISPRFAAHMILGTAFLTLGKTGPTLFKFMGDAHTMIAEGKFPPGMSRGTGFEGNVLKDIHDPVKFHQVLGGRTLGRLFSDSFTARMHLDKVTGAAHAWHHFLETWTDHYRVMAYLYGKDHAERKGENVGLNDAELSDARRLGITPQEYSGVLLANKVMADNLARTPLENSIIRMIMPFGGWTHHVLRYVMQFPLDHPLRTNFLANLGEQSYEADNTGLPQYLFHLMFLGHPDSNGNVNVIDFRQWNPLRDVANYMTLAGWVTQLNPLAEGVLSALGINSATGAPELYPQLQYSSFYGGSQTQTPTGNTALSMLGAYIPESSLLDHYLKISNYTRSLAKYDPEAYKSQLWQSLNFPWAPKQINVDQIVAKQEVDRLTTMKDMVTNALATNDPSQLNGLKGPFPYQGWYFTGDQIKDIIGAANKWAQETGVQIPASDLIQLPTAPVIPDTSRTAPVSLMPA